MEELGMVNEKNKCCGCGLCTIKCPNQAIEMKEDEYGYLYPFINKDKCINCGICKKVCEYNKEKKVDNFEKKTYAAVSKDQAILNSTASGGIFTSIAKAFIERGGVVFGCALLNEDNKFIVKHIKVDKIKDLDKLKGSKYVQSNIINVYKDIKQELEKGNKILFCGTPCQVAAVKGFASDSDKLFTIDIICHGVPNNKLFNEYIKYLNDKENIRIEDFKFRDKSKGWGLFYSYFYYDLKKKKYNKKVQPSFKSSYYQLFLDSYIYRDNCYNCCYANDKRVGDITIGDYWGIEEEHHNLIADKKVQPNKGVSCIIVNSNKGEELLKNEINGIELFESDFKKVEKHNHQLHQPAVCNIDRKKILDSYKNNGYQELEKYYKKKNILKNCIKNIWYHIPYKVRKIVKK